MHCRFPRGVVARTSGEFANSSIHPTWNSFRACDKPARPRLAPKVGIWGLDRGGKPSVYDYGYP